MILFLQIVVGSAIGVFLGGYFLVGSIQAKMTQIMFSLQVSLKKLNDELRDELKDIQRAVTTRKRSDDY